MAFVPSYWRETPQRYRYEAVRCEECAKVFFPPRRSCDPWCNCKLEPHTVAQEGRVLTHTVIHIGPDQLSDETPYVLAICEMDDGARLTAQVVDCSPEKVEAGLRVRIEFRRIQKDGESGILMYGYKVVPA